MNVNHIVNAMGGVACGVLAYVFGAPDAWMVGLVVLVVLDYVTGLMKAYVSGELCSKVGFKGILKKLMYFAIVAVAVIIDTLTGAGGRAARGLHRVPDRQRRRVDFGKLRRRGPARAEGVGQSAGEAKGRSGGTGNGHEMKPLAQKRIRRSQKADAPEESVSFRGDFLVAESTLGKRYPWKL